MNKPIYIKRVDKDGYYCSNQETHETKYLTSKQICENCSAEVVRILNSWVQVHVGNCNVDNCNF